MKQTGNSWPFQCICIILFSCLLTPSCTHDPINFEQLDTICFESEVLPLLQNSCTTSGCHDASTAAEEVILTDYASIMQIVTPGDPRASRLYDVITNMNRENFMPPNGPLPLKDRSLIQVWIAQGSMNTKCPDEIIDTGNTNPIDWGDSVCFNQDILPVFLLNCATSGCHNVASHAEGYELTDYASILSSEEGIVPFNPESSEIYLAITSTESDDRMPPYDALTSAQINAIRTWITEGALNSDCSDYLCDTLNAISFTNQVFPVLQNNCITCHNSPPGDGGILLNNYAYVLAASGAMRNGTPVLTGALRHINGFAPMPSIDYMLNECSIRTIELWISQGALDN